MVLFINSTQIKFKNVAYVNIIEYILFDFDKMEDLRNIYNMRNKVI